MKNSFRSDEALGAKDQKTSGIQIENLRGLANNLGLSPSNIAKALEIAKHDFGRAEQFIHNHAGGNY
jgi:hypothetical protein